MKAKHQRLIFIGFSVVFLCVASLLVLRAFSQNLVFFYSPSDISAKPPSIGQTIRIGGLVEKSSVKHGIGDELHFIITDGKSNLPVDYKGMLPALFREGQGAVAEGSLSENGRFNASRILTKHDENYMPREVVDALKKSGRWKEGEK
jgi:cytochrome c-type biogenesis protein CcmE